jgi:hypothetical protein
VASRSPSTSGRVSASSPPLSGFDHDVDIAQSRRRVVEASDRDLRPRGEVEINGWKMRAPLRLNPSRLLAASSRAPR